MAALLVIESGVEVDYQSVSFGSVPRRIGVYAYAMTGKHAMRGEIKVTAVKRDAEDSLQMLTHALQSFRCADDSGRTARSTLRESGTAVKHVKVMALDGPRNVLFEPVEHRRRSVRVKEIGVWRNGGMV